MKSLLVLLAAGSLSLSAGIAGSKHDLSSTAGATLAKFATTQTCVFCHTPHNSATVQTIPLWNKTSQTAAYTTYTSPGVILVSGAAPTQPAGASLACMTCHDGSLSMGAVLNLGGVAATIAASGATAAVTAGGLLLGGAKLGMDLSNDHPVSMAYPTDLIAGNNGFVTRTTVLAYANNVKLFSNNVECASCHDVHNSTAFQPFLRNDMAASKLCTQCHIK